MEKIKLVVLKTGEIREVSKEDFETFKKDGRMKKFEIFKEIKETVVDFIEDKFDEVKEIVSDFIGDKIDETEEVVEEKITEIKEEVTEKIEGVSKKIKTSKK